MDLEMHVVMAMTSEVLHTRHYGVLGFLFMEDNTAADLDFLTTVNFHMGDHGGEEEAEEGAAEAEHRRLETVEEEEETEEEDLEEDGEEDEEVVIHEPAEPTEYRFAFYKFFDAIPATNNFYHYEGSLTTPTCDEAVNWYVNKNIIRVNHNQLELFRSLWVEESFTDLADEG